MNPLYRLGPLIDELSEESSNNTRDDDDVTSNLINEMKLVSENFHKEYDEISTLMDEQISFDTKASDK